MNRFTIRETMWIDPNKGLRAYLAEAAESRRWIAEPDPADSTCKRRQRPIVADREKPAAQSHGGAPALVQGPNHLN